MPRKGILSATRDILKHWPLLYQPLELTRHVWR